jgi:hypothetical protein
MNDRDAIRERGRSLEDEWAARRTQEAIAKLRGRTQQEQERRRLGERTGIRSAALLQRMRDLGFDADSAELLFLVPLIGVARVDGAIDYAERVTVKSLAVRGGVAPGSPAWATLDGWLIDPPSDETLQAMLDLLRDVLSALPPGEATDVRARLQGAQARVARASGGFLGAGAVSRAERRYLEKTARGF